MQSTFASLGVRSELVQQLTREGLTEPTPVQEAAIPRLMAGADIIGQAQTGTGKTLAFLLPILEAIHPGKEMTEALIVTPTRELAIQITAEAKKLASAVGATILAAYGGQDVEAQIRKLRGSPHVVIGTPGRLLDHIRRGTLRLDRVSMLVLDEADQMLTMGFLPEVENIIAELPRNRQTMLFSATMPDTIRQLAAQYMRKPENIRIAGKRVTLEGIRQILVETTDRNKLDTLISLIERFQPYLAVIFCRTKIRAKKLTESLTEVGINADELHGDLSQAKREQVMKRFRDAKLQILVATDVAARGLDVEGVTHVFNYDIPHDTDSYIHRIGRTGRAGAKGMAVTLAAPRDRNFLTLIERKIGASIDVYSLDGTSENKRSGNSRGPREESQEGQRPRGRSSDNRGGGSRRGAGRGEGGSARGERSRGKFSSRSDAKPGVRGEGRAAGRPDGRSEARSAGRSDSRAEGRTEGRSAGRSDYRSESRTAGRSDNRTEGRTAGRSDYRTEGRPAGRSDNRTEGRTAGRSDNRSEARSYGRSDSRTEPRSDNRIGTGPRGRTDNKPRGNAEGNRENNRNRENSRSSESTRNRESNRNETRGAKRNGPGSNRDGFRGKGK